MKFSQDEKIKNTSEGSTSKPSFGPWMDSSVSTLHC